MDNKENNNDKEKIKSQNKERFNELHDFRLIIDETYNHELGLDELIYHVTDKLIDGCLVFNSVNDIDFKNKENDNLYFFVGTLFNNVPGLISVLIENYKISFCKSSVFYWYELEREIIPILEEIIIRNRKFYFLGRNRIFSFLDSNKNVFYVKKRLT
jgi:hypothetical protein